MIVKGSEEMGVRGSSWSSDFIVGAGVPGGVRVPWPKAEGRMQNAETIAANNAHNRLIRGERIMFIRTFSGDGGMVAEGGDWFNPQFSHLVKNSYSV